MALRKNMRPKIARDRRGKITSGTKSVSSKTGKEFPKSLDHFNISKFPELVELYGEKPQSLLICFPSNNIEDFLVSQWSEWGSKGDVAIMKASCDGEEHINHQTGEVTQCQCPDGSCEKGLKCYTGLRAYICNPHNKGMLVSPVCYQFQTMSPNSGDNIYWGIKPVWDMTGGRIIGVFFWLKVRMVEILVEGQKQKFPVWDIAPVGDLPTIKALSERGKQPTSPENILDIPLYGGKASVELAWPQQEEVVEELPAPDTGPELLVDLVNRVGVSEAFVDHKEAIIKLIIKGNDRSMQEDLQLARFLLRETTGDNEAQCDEIVQTISKYNNRRKAKTLDDLKRLPKNAENVAFAKEFLARSEQLYREYKQ